MQCIFQSRIFYSVWARGLLSNVEDEMKRNRTYNLNDISTEEMANEKLEEAKARYQSLTQKKVNKGWVSLLFLALNIIVVLVIALIEFGGEEEVQPFSEVWATWLSNYRFFFCILGVIAIFYLSDMMRTAIIIKHTTGHFRFRVAFKSCLLCKYYDNITPLGSGGQPFQMYYLAKHIPTGPATSLPIIVLFLSQLVFFLICMVTFIFQPHAVNDAFRITAYIGSAFYLLVPATVMAFSFMPKLMSGILRFILRVGEKIRLVKDFDKTYEKTIHSIEEYRIAFKSVGKSVWTVLSVSFFSAINYIAILSVPYFVVRICGFDIDYFYVTAMTIYITAAVTFIPTPGTSGAAESAFYIVFSVLEGSFLFWGMILWRVSVYYLVIFIGLIAIFQDYMAKYREISQLSDFITSAEKRKQEIAESQSQAQPKPTKSYKDLFYDDGEGSMFIGNDDSDKH